MKEFFKNRIFLIILLLNVSLLECKLSQHHINSNINVHGEHAQTEVQSQNIHPSTTSPQISLNNTEELINVEDAPLPDLKLDTIFECTQIIEDSSAKLQASCNAKAAKGCFYVKSELNFGYCVSKNKDECPSFLVQFDCDKQSTCFWNELIGSCRTLLKDLECSDFYANEINCNKFGVFCVFHDKFCLTNEQYRIEQEKEDQREKTKTTEEKEKQKQKQQEQKKEEEKEKQQEEEQKKQQEEQEEQQNKEEEQKQKKEQENKKQHAKKADKGYFYFIDQYWNIDFGLLFGTEKEQEL